jgi:hypothetical protein
MVPVSDRCEPSTAARPGTDLAHHAARLPPSSLIEDLRGAGQVPGPGC